MVSTCRKLSKAYVSSKTRNPFLGLIYTIPHYLLKKSADTCWIDGGKQANPLIISESQKASTNIQVATLQINSVINKSQCHQTESHSVPEKHHIKIPVPNQTPSVAIKANSSSVSTDVSKTMLINQWTNQSNVNQYTVFPFVISCILLNVGKWKETSLQEGMPNQSDYI